MGRTMFFVQPKGEKTAKQLLLMYDLNEAIDQFT